MVSVPPGMTASGKRVRKIFPGQTEAERFAGRMRAAHNTGLRGSMISATLAREAMEAQELLRPHGVSLLDAARRVVGMLGDETAKEAFKDRLVRARAWGERHWSDRYENDIGKMEKWLPGWFLKTACGLITRPMIDRALGEMGAQARSTLDARGARVLAVANFRERHRKTSTVSIATVPQCAAMFRACESPGQRWAVALLLFAGVRPEGELSRLDWSAVGPASIRISPEVSKTNSDRIIPITPRLARLLKGHPPEGPVTPPRWAKSIQRIRAAAGVAGEQDIARHTFASHFLAAFGEKDAKDALGHAQGSTTLFRHYRRAVEESAGKKYFGIRPPKKKAARKKVKKSPP